MLYDAVIELNKKKIIDSIVVLLAGAGISQLLVVALSPILTRFFTPEDLGVYGSYVTLISTLVVFSTGRYEFVLLLPNTKVNSHSVYDYTLRRTFKFTIVSTVFISALAFLIQDLKIDGSGAIYFIPLGTYLLSLFNLRTQWSIAQLNYTVVSKGRFFQSLSVPLLSILLGLFVGSSYLALVLCDCIGRLIGARLLGSPNRSTQNTAPPADAALIHERYRKFSLFEQITAFLSISSLQLPIVLMPVIFDSKVAGYYFIVYRVVTAPVALISNAMVDVFKNLALSEIESRGSCTNAMSKTVLYLFLIGFLPCLLLGYYGQMLFIFAFGEEWGIAGIYAQILAPSLLLRLIACPVAFVLQLREKVTTNMLIYLLFFIITCASLFAGNYMKSAEELVVLLSAGACIFYCTQLYFAYRYSKAI